MPPLIAVIDYGAGNLRSVTKAITELGLASELVTKAEDIETAETIIFPGVGSAGHAMKFLSDTGLDAAISRRISEGALYIGICLGMQVLFETSDEDNATCLGIFRGKVKRLNSGPGLKVPHIGWNQVEIVKDDQIFGGVPDAANFYFVHSYVADEVDPSIVKARTQHGEYFPSVVRKDRVVGIQFHPEKSSAFGLRMLRNILEVT